MPLYDYECAQCGKIIEVRHGFNQTHALPCEACGGALRRIINPAPIIFKGSGFYVTDSRKKPAAESKPSPAAAPKPDTPAPSTPPSGSSKESAA